MRSETSVVTIQYRLQEWAAQIKDCQNRPEGMKVSDWCEIHGISNPLLDCSRQNRWNPPGRSFLYMSYMEKMEKYNDELSLGEYVCLLEMRTPEKTEYSFCRFKIKKTGSIIDLSYNDVSLYELRKRLKDYGDKVAYSEAQKILSDIDIMSHINDEKYIQNKIDENLKSNLEINNQINILMQNNI